MTAITDHQRDMTTLAIHNMREYLEGVKDNQGLYAYDLLPQSRVNISHIQMTKHAPINDHPYSKEWLNYL